MVILFLLGVGVGAGLLIQFRQRHQDSPPRIGHVAIGNRVRVWRCRVLRRHTEDLVFAGPEVFYRCPHCGQRSAGWNVALGRKSEAV